MLHAKGDLTVVLTLWDRSSYTYRWMEWMNQQRFPYKILIADGGSDKEIERYLSDYSNYPELDYEYIRYPFDSSVDLYFKKLADVSSKVKSKFVIIADNDDFILLEPLSKNIEILKNNPEIDTFGPEQFRLEIKKKYSTLEDLVDTDNGEIIFRKVLSPTLKKSLLNADPMIRLIDVVKNFHSSFIFYGLHRSESFSESFRRFAKLKMKQLIFCEWHLLYSFAISGRIQLGVGYPFLIRQENTSQGATPTYETDKLSAVFLYKGWSKQLYDMIGDLYDQILKAGYKGTLLEFEATFIKNFNAYLLQGMQFRGVAEKYRNSKLLFKFGKYLFKLYQGFRIKKMSAYEVACEKNLSRLISFLQAYRSNFKNSV